LENICAYHATPPIVTAKISTTRRPSLCGGTPRLTVTVALLFRLHVRRLDAGCRWKLPDLILQIGGDPHEISRHIWISGGLCHPKQR